MIDRKYKPLINAWGEVRRFVKEMKYPVLATSILVSSIIYSRYYYDNHHKNKTNNYEQKSENNKKSIESVFK